MSVVDEKSIFIAMKQDGPFAIHQYASCAHPFSPQNRQWVKTFQQDRQMATKYRAVRDQLFDLLQIACFDEIPGLIQNPALREERSERAYRLLGNLFGISGELSAIRSKIHEYMNTADAVISQLRGKVLAAYGSHIEISNEIETAKNPVDLLLMIFDDRYHKKIRFEAKRKLVLMGLAGSIDQRERETDIENKFASLPEFSQPIRVESATQNWRVGNCLPAQPPRCQRFQLHRGGSDRRGSGTPPARICRKRKAHAGQTPFIPSQRAGSAGVRDRAQKGFRRQSA